MAFHLSQGKTTVPTKTYKALQLQPSSPMPVTSPATTVWALHHSVHTTPDFLQVCFPLRTWVLALPSNWNALLPPNLVKHLLLPHPHAWQMAYSHWGLPWPLSINHKPTFHISLSCFPLLLNTQHNFNHFFYLLSDLFLSGLSPAVSPKCRPVPSHGMHSINICWKDEQIRTMAGIGSIKPNLLWGPVSESVWNFTPPAQLIPVMSTFYTRLCVSLNMCALLPGITLSCLSVTFFSFISLPMR